MKSLIIFLLLTACEKPCILPVGKYVYRSGDMVTYLSVDKDRYAIYSVLPDVWSPASTGEITCLSNGYAMRMDGQSFHWATKGRIENGKLIFYDPVHKKDLIFVPVNN